MTNKVIFYAPNINVGGGLVLLQALLSQPGSESYYFVLDERASAKLKIVDHPNVFWVSSGIKSRLKAERYLQDFSAEFSVICLHNIPPLFSVKAKVVVFVQNRLLLEPIQWSLSNYRVAVRTFLEKTLLKTKFKSVDFFIVQTSTMFRQISSFLRIEASFVKVCPFVNDKTHELFSLKNSNENYLSNSDVENFSFIYPADDQKHKNHLLLIDAWRQLYELGLRPNLFITLHQHSNVLAKINELKVTHPGINISNLGVISHDLLLQKYNSVAALIFPSTLESFGLPLLEAGAVGLPIIASDLDYVYDVCSPVQTFISDDSKSLARAVCRFLRRNCELNNVVSVKEFLNQIKG